MPTVTVSSACSGSSPRTFADVDCRHARDRLGIPAQGVRREGYAAGAGGLDSSAQGVQGGGIGGDLPAEVVDQVAHLLRNRALAVR